MTDRISISLDAGAQKALSALQESKPVRTPLALIIREAIFFYAKSINVSIKPVPSPSSPRRASPSARVRAAKAEAPKASPAPASRYPAGLEEGVRALCREVWKKGGPFQLDGQTCESYSTAVDWLLAHAAETMERRKLDVEGYLAFRRSQMLAGGEAGL